jgi:hypothetical protein
MNPNHGTGGPHRARAGPPATCRIRRRISGNTYFEAAPVLSVTLTFEATRGVPRRSAGDMRRAWTGGAVWAAPPERFDTPAYR